MHKIKEIKCVIWDLDNTIWDGVLIESDDIKIKPNIEDIIKTLDSRGILNSIASRNNFDDAMEKLKSYGLDEYFIYPEINWNAKSNSISNIQKNLNISMDSMLFIDDQPFEREEVKSIYPDINCMDASEYSGLLEQGSMNPKFITEDSKRRRKMYMEDIVRKGDEENYKGPKESFLASLEMEFIISEAKEEDLKRAEELTVRTNQLNATGKTYSYDELNAFRESDTHKLLVCELTDKYGSYGKIGLALIEINEDNWHLRLLLMSCRVMSRGVGTVLLYYIMQMAKADGKRLLADFRQTDRNRMMYVSYRFVNFKEIYNDNQGNIIFENDLSNIPKQPGYLKVKIM